MAADVAAGIYTRISLATEGDTTKTDDQERICRELAGRLGWDVAEVYCDHSRSAWQKNRNRPAWNKMLADVDAGKINAIITYHGDRLVRRPEDLTDLLRLAESKGVKLASPSSTKDLDTDRLELWIRAAFAEEESQRLSERRKAQYERWRREGKVRTGGRGGRAFGFEKDGITHVPAEVDAIRDSARRILLGEATNSIVRSMTLPTPAGFPMTDSTLKKILLRPRTAGLMPDGESKAAWEPVLDRQTWEMVATILRIRAESTGYEATSVRRWLGSGLYLCGECGKPLAIRMSRGQRGKGNQTGYSCVAPGCRRVWRAAALLDAYIAGWVVTRLSNPDTPDVEISLTDGLAAELAQLERRRTETEDYIAGLADAPGRRLDVLMRALDGFDTRIAAIREQMTSGTGARLRAEYKGLTREEWDELPLDVRRSLVRACCTVTVLRSGQRGPGFRPEHVRVEPV